MTDDQAQDELERLYAELQTINVRAPGWKKKYPAQVARYNALVKQIRLLSAQLDKE